MFFKNLCEPLSFPMTRLQLLSRWRPMLFDRLARESDQSGPPINVREPVTDLQTVVREIAAEMAARQDRGAVADYIPELARVDAGAFGMVVIDAEGKVHAAGDADRPF